MAARLMITDWRGPQSWTAPQRARSAELVSCYPRWNEAPIPGVPYLIGQQCGFSLYLGATPVPAPTENQFMKDVCNEGIAYGYDLWRLIDPQGAQHVVRLCNYDAAVGEGGSPGTATYMWNMTRPVVARWFAQRMADYFPGAAGWHVDYYSDLEFVLSGQAEAPDSLNPGMDNIYHPQGPAAGWTNYMRGIARCLHEYRRIRTAQGKTTLIMGQQFHTKNAAQARELNARFVEVDPKRWADDAGVSPWQTYHDNEFAELTAWSVHGAPAANNAIEARYIGALSTQYKNDIMAYASARGMYVSWDRDATAGVGWPG